MTAQASEPQIFERILCGVDATSASLVAVRQALRLQDENGSVLLSAVANLTQAAHAGMAAPHAAELMQHEAEAALAEARAIAPFGTVAAGMLGDATCSVLVARAAGDADRWPQTVIVGVDGSLESAAAFTVARSVAARVGGSVRAVASTKDQLDREAVQAMRRSSRSTASPR